MTEKRFQKKLKKMKEQGERLKQEQKVKDTYAEYKPERKKRKFSNFMVIISALAIIGYVALDVILQHNVGCEISPTITPYWFAFWGGEIFMLAGIKVSKVFKDNSDNAVG